MGHTNDLGPNIFNSNGFFDNDILKTTFQKAVDRTLPYLDCFKAKMIKAIDEDTRRQKNV